MLRTQFGQAAQAHVDEKTWHRLVTKKNPPAVEFNRCPSLSLNLPMLCLLLLVVVIVLWWWLESERRGVWSALVAVIAMTVGSQTGINSEGIAGWW